MQQIPGHPDYFVNEEGEIFTNVYKKMRKMKGADNNGYKYVCLKVNGKTKLYQLHRLVAKTFLDTYSEDLQVDHIDRCKTNNSVNNLRMVNHSENAQNRSCKGYTWNKKDKRWQAQITINGKKIFLGYYDTEEEAGEAYLRGKQKYHKYGN